MTNRPYNYVAYIDEAGDPGLRKVRPIDPDGSSEWLTIAAVVVRAENERDVVDWVREAKELLRSKQRPDLHFRHLNAPSKLAVCRLAATKPLRAFVVASNKKNMRQYRNHRAEKVRSQEFFYNWCNRLLLERVTDFACRQAKKDGLLTPLTRFEYSERGGFSYGQMQAYHDYMKLKGPNLYKTKYEVQWDAIRRDQVARFRHAERAGLQLADVVASAFYQAADALGPTWDTRFAEALRPRMGRLGRRIRDVGVVLQPTPAWKAQLTAEQQQIFRFYGYEFQGGAAGPGLV